MCMEGGERFGKVSAGILTELRQDSGVNVL